MVHDHDESGLVHLESSRCRLLLFLLGVVGVEVGGYEHWGSAITFIHLPAPFSGEVLPPPFLGFLPPESRANALGHVDRLHISFRQRRHSAFIKINAGCHLRYLANIF